MPSTPLLLRPLNDIVTTNQAEDQQIDLLTYFDDPLTTGLTARFELANPSPGGGISNVVLYDQPGQGAPLSVRNFLGYVNSGAYRNSIIHRSIPTFIVQGGGYVVNGLASTLANPANAVTEVVESPPVLNEFSVGRSNTRGTLALAKLGGNPNSGTSQWFFNLGDNASNLDAQNGGFTVFGEVQSAADLVAVDGIAARPTFNHRFAADRDQSG
jgi:cyclophilin family peptidyl-prolyl cis-trans isomerase